MTQSQSQSRIDKDTFLELVRESGLMSPERLARALKQMAPTDRGRVVARGLVEQGLLTKFQAERLLACKTDGFMIGQYRILDELGRGGMGRVFKAEHMTMGRIVALKILSPALTKTERAREMFHREVKAAAKLNHPNIVTAFDANQIGERCFLVMEFVDGPNLQELVKNHGLLPVTQACDYVRQAALGLEYAHQLGMVHRDIKPANLLVRNTTSKATANASIVKILDFGLARLNASEDGMPGHDSLFTKPRSVMGTPDFLSPEQARNLHATDGRSDIYSLGCTFYYMLTGQVPFAGGTTMEKLVRHSTDEAKPIYSLRPEIPVEVGDIVRRMMAKKPDDRYQSAAELAEALMPISGNEPATWVAVQPLLAEEILPVSSKNLPRIPVTQTGDDPWANIDDDSALHGTLSGEAATTAVTKNGSSPRHRAIPSTPEWIWNLIGLLLILGVVAGVVLAIRYFIVSA